MKGGSILRLLEHSQRTHGNGKNINSTGKYPKVKNHQTINNFNMAFTREETHLK